MKSIKAVLAITKPFSVLLFASLNANLASAQNSTFSLRAYPTDSQIKIAQTQPTSPSCEAEFAQMLTSLTDERQLSISSRFTRVTSENYTGYPVGRSVLHTIAIQGSASASIMNSPQFLLSTIGSFFEECSTAGAITIIDLDSRLASAETIGLVDGQPAFFECAQGIVTTQIPWGYHDCSP